MTTTTTRPAKANSSRRRIVGAVFQSLDGVMQSPGAPTEDPTGAFDLGGWMTSYFDETAGGVIGALFARPFAMLFGRKSYEMLAGHWPYVTGEAAALGAAFTTADKYVLTRGDDPLEWENSHRLSGMDAVRELKDRNGPDLVIQGSASIYPQLLAAGLIDELILFSFPVVLGRGKRLFGDGTPPFALRLVEHHVSQSGAMIGRYEPAGDIPLGSFGQDEPSAREIARRRRLQLEG